MIIETMNSKRQATTYLQTNMPPSKKQKRSHKAIKVQADRKVNKSISFLDLPSEVRNSIYFYAVKKNTVITLHHGNEEQDHAAVGPPIMRTSSQIRHEAMQIFMEHNTFQLCSREEYGMSTPRTERWLSLLEPKSKKLMRHIEFFVSVNTPPPPSASPLLSISTQIIPGRLSIDISPDYTSFTLRSEIKLLPEDEDAILDIIEQALEDDVLNNKSDTWLHGNFITDLALRITTTNNDNLLIALDPIDLFTAEDVQVEWVPHRHRGITSSTPPRRRREGLWPAARLHSRSPLIPTLVPRRSRRGFLIYPFEE
jgi:hypothetical protein